MDLMSVRVICVIDMYQKAGMTCLGHCDQVTLVPALNSLAVRGSITVGRA